MSLSAEQLTAALERLKRIQSKNASLQDQMPKASNAWHRHEDIDDEVHELQATIETELEQLGELT